MLLGSAGAKAVRKYVGEIDPCSLVACPCIVILNFILLRRTTGNLQGLYLMPGSKRLKK